MYYVFRTYQTSLSSIRNLCPSQITFKWLIFIFFQINLYKILKTLLNHEYKDNIIIIKIYKIPLVSFQAQSFTHFELVESKYVVLHYRQKVKFLHNKQSSKQI